MRENFSGVTERVTELLHTRTDGFMVNAREMDTDPLPGKKMRLTILYTCQGSACVFTIQGGKGMNRRSLVEKAIK
jgi:hypothetical protein